MVYQGGFPSLVGGAFFMGLLWGWVVYKTEFIKTVEHQEKRCYLNMWIFLR